MFLNERMKNHVEIKYYWSEGLAREAGISLNHFIALFKKSTGLPPYRDLTEQRINRAVLLLSALSVSPGEFRKRGGQRNQVIFRQ